jgi:integrase
MDFMAVISASDSFPRYRLRYRFLPKPYFLTRPSGLFVRFLIPADLRGQLGCRFVVRSLGDRRGDHARLVAAAQAMALSALFDRVRQGVAVMDIKKLLESAQRAADSGAMREWTATGVQVGRVNFGNVEARGREDTLDFIQAVKAALDAPGNAPLPTELASSPQAAPPAAKVAEGPKLSGEIASHLADLERRQLSADTITESRHSLRIFLAVTGDIPVSEIKAAHLRAFLDAVRWWPDRATLKPAYRGMSVLQIIAAGKKEQVRSPSPHTINKHTQRVSTFLNGLVNMDLLGKNPMKAIKPEIDTSTDLDTGRPFTKEELTKMFEPERFKAWASKYPHRWWGAILGLYTGARVNEVGQIYLDDVRQINGVWGVFFWKSARGTKRSQKIKNKSSIRFVPLAQPVLDAGFLDFIEDIRATGHPRLFPHLPAGTAKDGTPNGKGYGRQLSRQFAAYMKTIGVEKGTAFHSFRHTMSTSLAEVGVPSADIAMITGHAVPNSVPTLDNHYIHIAQINTLLKRVEILSEFESNISLLKYRKGQFSSLLEKIEEIHP